MANTIENILERFELPKGRILSLHIGLKPFKEATGVSDYEALTRDILDCFQTRFSPKTILVPSFTYTFTRSGLYHAVFSKSEVGRFSEEVRRAGSIYRTPNPVFSFLDTNALLKGDESIDHARAFGKGSVFEHLQAKNPIIINMGLPHLVSPQLHHYEEVLGVDYRYHKTFEGVVYSDATTHYDMNYVWFVRSLDADRPTWNRKRIEQDLVEADVWKKFTVGDASFGWMESDALWSFAEERMRGNPHYLVESGDA